MEHKVAVYIRVASESQISVDSQQESLRSFAKAQGFDDMKFYVDNGYSGLNFNRPAFAVLNDDISAGKVKTVIAVNESRIARDFPLAFEWFENVQKKGVSILLLHGPNPIPLDMRRNLLALYKGKRMGTRHK